MKLGTILGVKLNYLKRSKSFYALIAINYIVFAIYDPKSFLLMPSMEHYITRFLFQQLSIVFTTIFFVELVFNEKNLRSIKNYMVIYTGSLKTEVYGSAIFCILINISALLMSHLLLLCINYISYGEIIVSIPLVNFAIVSMQIITTTLFVMSIRMLLKKNIYVYGLFYLTILGMLAINNVFISIPLTIKIIGIEGAGYYVTYGWQLWCGKGVQLLIYLMLFMFSLQGLNRESKCA